MPAWTSGPRPRQARWLALGVLSVGLMFVLGPGPLSDAVFVLIAAIGVVGLNLLTGYTGQISLGHAFFLGVGAYTAGVLGGTDHLTAAIWLPAAGIVAGLCGLLVGPMALRLKGLYLAIVTLALVYIGGYLFTNMTSITGASQGRAIPAIEFGSAFNLSAGTRFHIAGVLINQNRGYYLVALVILWLTIGFSHNLRRTRIGRAFQAVRERELAASVIGIDVARTKVTAFVVSSFLAGISGALFASFLSYVVPSQWNLDLSVDYAAAVIIGGMGTVLGPVLGSIVVFGLPYVITNLPFVSENGATSGVSPSDLTNILYGVLIVVFLMAEPLGLVGFAKRVGSLPGTWRGDGNRVIPHGEPAPQTAHPVVAANPTRTTACPRDSEVPTTEGGEVPA